MTRLQLGPGVQSHQEQAMKLGWILVLLFLMERGIQWDLDRKRPFPWVLDLPSELDWVVLPETITPTDPAQSSRGDSILQPFFS